MVEERMTRTFAGFWGELLFVRFHESGTLLWPRNEEPADWVFNLLSGIAHPRILDLGSGTGDLDILLAQGGAQVTAVDQMQPVLQDGMLHMTVTYDPETRLLWFDPAFHSRDGTVIVLDNRYDAGKPNRPGFGRYLYPKEELAELCTNAGFSVQEGEHIFEDDYLLIGRSA